MEKEKDFVAGVGREAEIDGLEVEEERGSRGSGFETVRELLRVEVVNEREVDWRDEFEREEVVEGRG